MGTPVVSYAPRPIFIVESVGSVESDASALSITEVSGEFWKDGGAVLVGWSDGEERTSAGDGCLHLYIVPCCTMCLRLTHK